MKDYELLLCDLSSRLPYDVKVQVIGVSDYTGEYLSPKIKTLDYLLLGKLGAIVKGYRKDEIKPYLFPLSSMTKEQEEEFKTLYYRYLESAFIFNERFAYDRYSIKDIGFYPCYLQDWLNKNHFDYRGLIKKGLALDATNLNIY